MGGKEINIKEIMPSFQCNGHTQSRIRILLICLRIVSKKAFNYCVFEESYLPALTDNFNTNLIVVPFSFYYPHKFNILSFVLFLKLPHMLTSELICPDFLVCNKRHVQSSILSFCGTSSFPLFPQK